MLVEAVCDARAKREDPERLAAGHDRHEHQRLRPDPLERLPVGAQPLELVEVLGRDRAQQQRLAPLEDVRNLAVLPLERERRRQRLEHRLHGGVGGHARDAGEDVVADDVHVAGVREPGHADLRDPGGDLVLLERRREELAGLGQQPQAVVGPLAVGDLHDHRADPDHLAVVGVDGVVAGEPVAALALLQRGVGGRLRVHDRLAGLEHPLVERHKHRRQLADDVRELPPDVLLRRQPVDRGQRVVDSDETEVAVPEADPDGSGDEQRVQLRIRLPRRLEEERVVDRKRRAACELMGERQVGARELPPRLAGAERDRPEQAASGLERHDDVRRGVEPAVELEVLLVHRRPRERRLPRVLDQIRLGRPEHLRHRVRRVLVGRVSAAELPQQLLACRVAVTDHDLTQVPVVDHVDDAVVGEARHEQRRERVEGGVDVDRGRKDGAGLVDEPCPFLGGALGRDIVDDVDHELGLARLRQDRRRAQERPAFLAVRQQPVADDALLGTLRDERAAVRQLVGRHRRPVLANHRVPLHQLLDRQREQLLAGLEAEQPCRGVVGVGERPVRALGGDPVRDVAEDDVELVRGDRRRGHGRSIATECDDDYSISERDPGASPDPLVVPVYDRENAYSLLFGVPKPKLL